MDDLRIPRFKLGAVPGHGFLYPVFEIDSWLPAQLLHGFGVVADASWNVDSSCVGFPVDFGSNSANLHNCIYYLLHGSFNATAEVIDLRGLSFLSEESIASDNVFNIGEISRGRRVAHCKLLAA